MNVNENLHFSWKTCLGEEIQPSFLATHLIRDSSHFIFILMADEFCFLKLRKLTLREIPLGICFAVRGAEDWVNLSKLFLFSCEPYHSHFQQSGKFLKLFPYGIAGLSRWRKLAISRDFSRAWKALNSCLSELFVYIG